MPHTVAGTNSEMSRTVMPPEGAGQYSVRNPTAAVSISLTHTLTGSTSMFTDAKATVSTNKSALEA